MRICESVYQFTKNGGGSIKGKEGIFKKFRHLSIRMTVYYSLVIALFFFMLVIVIIAIFSTRWKEEMNKVVVQKVDLLEKHIEKEIEDINNVHYTLLDNPLIQRLSAQAEEYPLSSEEKEELKKQFQLYKQKNANMVSSFIVNTKGEILDSRSANQIYHQLIGSNRYFINMVSSKRMSYFSPPSTFPLEMANPSQQQKNTITYYGKYYDTDTYKNRGYLIINWKVSGIFAEVDELCENTFQEAFVVNELNEVIYGLNEPGEEDIQNILMQAQKIRTSNMVEINHKKYLLYSKVVNNYPEWHFVGLISFESMNSHLTEVYRIMSVIVLIAFTIVVIISFHISKGITRPIYAIIKEMKKLGAGGKAELIKARTSDEMKDLVDGFNSMSGDIEQLKVKILEEQEQKKNYEVAIMKSQLELLQSQINPHFIHNTLNTLKYMAQKENNRELAETISAFNTLLRASMSIGNDSITVADEIENIHNYIKIQKQRYDAAIEVYCFCYKDTEYALLPKLILQPLVENSLYHGIIPKGEGSINVSFIRMGEELMISVSDNGVGIPIEKQKNILREKKNTKRGYNNIGLANVNERLIMHYGEGSQLNILSSEEYGTFISFKIPYQTV